MTDSKKQSLNKTEETAPKLDGDCQPAVDAKGADSSNGTDRNSPVEQTLISAEPTPQDGVTADDVTRDDGTTDDATRGNATTAQTMISAESSRAPGIDNAFADESRPPTTEAAATVLSGSLPGTVDFRPNRESAAPIQIGRFDVSRLLGRGAFGAVYLADDPRLGRKVAIKVARPGVIDSDEDVQRFFREGRAAARLRHPNIVPVYEVGSADGTNYIVTEFIHGRTLGALLKQKKKLTPREAVPLIRQIADALHYAHAQGVIHRDIKPDNILLDGHGQLHIADFGLARHDEDITRTTEGSIMGTPAYMSPEQAEGHANTADGRTDIWSLGIIFNEMLAGKRPFSGTLTQVLLDVKEREVVPLRQLDRTIPADLETICGKCLQKDPDKRFPTAGEVDEELARWERGEPIRSRPISTFARLVRFSKRNPLIASLIAGVCGSLLLGIIVSSVFAIDAANKTQIVLNTQEQRALEQVKSIRTATPASVPELIRSIQFSNDQVAGNKAVAELWKQLEASDHPKDSARFKMAVLQLDHATACERGIDTELVNELFRANGPEFLNLRSALATNSPLDLETLWSMVTDQEQDRTQRFRAAAALALFDPKNSAWTKVADEVTSQLLSQNTLELSAWIEALRPVRQHLYPHLRQAMQESESSVRHAAVDCAAALFRDQPEKLLELIEQSDEQQHRVLVRAFRDNPAAHAELAKRTAAALNAKNAAPNATQVNLALAMIEVSRGDAILKLLAAAADESLRTELIHRAGPSRVSWRFFADLFDHGDPDVTAAALLALGEYPLDTLSPNDRTSLMPKVIALFESHPSPAVHSAAEWLMRTWHLDSGLTTTRAQRGTTAAQESAAGQRNWYVNSVGITMARVITTPCELGSLPEEPDRPDFRELGLPDLEPRRKWKIPRNFEISTREISVADYLAFVIDTGRKSFQYDKRYAPDVTCPINSVKWFDAVAYCSWLSQQEGLPMCYPTPDKVGPAMQLPDDLLERTGYRLPTAAEWEFACRAGTTTPRHFGQTDRWINKYAWSELNSGEVSYPPGLLKPNRFGLFDMHGNVTEWCHTWWFEETWDVAASKRVDVLLDGSDPRRGILKEYRGGAFTDKPRAIRSAHRGGPDEEECGVEPYLVFESLGFRIVRTISSTGDAQPPVK